MQQILPDFRWFGRSLPPGLVVRGPTGGGGEGVGISDQQHLVQQKQLC